MGGRRHLLFPTAAAADALIADLQQQDVVQSEVGTTTLNRRVALEMAGEDHAIIWTTTTTTDDVEGGGTAEDAAAGAVKDASNLYGAWVAPREGLGDAAEVNLRHSRTAVRDLDGHAAVAVV